MTLLALFSMFLTNNKAKANHATGGELIYVHLGDSAYQFILKFYRDCKGPDAPQDFVLCIFNTCTNQQVTVPMPKWSGTLPPDNRANGSVVSPGCADVNTSCDQPAGNLPGYREWWYTCVVPALPFHCNYWRFGAVVNGGNALCCRNQTTNLVGTPSFYLETTFNSLYTWENSSPYYSVKPVPYVCLGQPFSFNNGALDVDGDSLWSSLMNPLQTANCSAAPSNTPMQALTPALNFTNNPFQTNNTFTLNGGNGQFSFTSGLIGAGVLSMKTREFRTKDTVPTYEIGFIMRDVQVQTISCSTIPPKLDTVSINNDSGVFINNIAYGCIGQTLEFCFMVTSTDTDAVLKLADNLSNIATMPGATITYTNQGTDTVIGCFSWLPTINDVGRHSFISLIKDSTCDPPGILFNYARTVDLEIFGPVVASPDTNVCLGEPAFLGVKGGGDYEWTVLSGTPNSLSNPNIANPVANPTAPTTYVVTSKLNNFCKNFTTDTVNIDVLTGPFIAGQKDDTTCPAQEVQLDLGLVKVPNANYTIDWTPTAGLSAANIENPVVNIKTSETYYVTISSNVNRCRTFDTVYIDVLSGMIVDNPDTAVCLGQAIDIRGTGDSRYIYTWESLVDQNAQYSNPGAVVTSIQPSDTGVDVSYVLTASYFKCLRDSILDVKITTEPNPTVTVNDDNTLCYGDTMQLNALVQPSSYGSYVYSWTPGAMLDFPDRKDPIFSAINEGVVTLDFVVTTPEAGCTATDQVVLEVYAADFLTVPNDTAICPGDTIALAMTIQPGAKFYWTPDFNISSISSENPRIWPVAD